MMAASSPFLNTQFRYVRYLLLIISLLCYCKSISQSFPYTFQTWDAKNGLSTNYCNVIAQDTTGYLYVGTNNGLYAFNGNNFKTLNYNIISNHISEGNVEDLIVDKYNRIWFASIEYGVGLINLQQKSLQVQYFRPDTTSDRYQDTKVSKLCFDSKGHLWVGTRGKGLFKFDTATKTFTAIPTENPRSLYNKYIRSLYLYKPDSLFVGLVNGLNIINPLTNRATHLKFRLSPGNRSLRPTVRKVLPIANDSFLLATDRGTFCLKLSEQTLSSIYTNQQQNIDFAKVVSNDIIRVSENEIWVATENQGILFYNTITHKFDYSYLTGTSKYTVPQNFISGFYKDKGGNIWIAQQSGLSLFQTENIIFSSVAFTNRDFFSGSFLSDGNNLLCIKSNSIASINTNSGDVAVRELAMPLPRNIVPNCAIIYTPEEYMVFWGKKIFTLNRKTLLSKQLPLVQDKVDSIFLKHFRVMQCIPDTLDGKKEYLLLVKTIKGNVLLNYNPDDGELTEYTPEDFERGSPDYDYTKVIKAGNGKYWISTLHNGLIYAEKKGITAKYAATENKKTRKIPPGEINDFVITNDNNIWLLINKKGLVCASLHNGEITGYETFSDKDGLTENRLYNIIADKNNNLWITTGSALFLFRVQQKDFLRYSVANGLSNIKFHITDVAMTCTGNGYIGLSDKFSNITWFDPSKNITSSKPILVLNNISVNNQLINITQATGGLQLLPDENNITFWHDIIDFDKTVFYKTIYKLENFANGWNTANQNNRQNYIQLPPGNYVYRIKLQYADGSFSPEQRVEFSIATIWYKTWWFKSIAALLGLGMIYLVIQNYINKKLHLQKKDLELQNAVALERARISTELHDDLGSGLSTIRILSQSLNGNSNSNVNPNLEKISSHSHELIQKMREIVWALNNENDTLDQLISYIRLQSSTLLDNAAISYQYHIPEIIPEIKITGGVRRHIQLLIKETVHNIIKHSRATQVVFTIVITNDLVITIHDNGIGIPADCTYTSSGSGVKNMKKHADAVQGLLAVKNHVGTTIQFSVKLQSLSHESVI